MLKEIIIKDFAIIDRLEQSLGPGLSCLTGETGAGKSILVDAISVVLGGKAGPEYLREGGDASVEASFDVSGLPGVLARLDDLGMRQGGELILRRVLASSGRGRAYINGSLANLSALQELGDRLVDIHGQHEHQSLLKIESHLDLLDSFCRLTVKAGEYRLAYQRLFEQKKRLDSLRALSRERAQRLDLLEFQRREIDEAQLVPGEEDDLLNQRARLMHADRLRALSDAALHGLKDMDGSALALLGEAVKSVREIASVAPDQAGCLSMLESAEVSISEASSYLRDFGGTLEADPERLSEVEGRLELVARLKKKYGSDITEVLRFREAVDAELSSIGRSEDELTDLTPRIASLEAELVKLAGELTLARHEGAKGFCGKVEKELAGLGMVKARFDVRFDTLAAPGTRGVEKAEFMFSANQGEPARPLAKIASGGELSRVMLVLKVILAKADSVPVLIFDEVDSGVGGATAGAVGRKLREAASGRQVLCITHLPQIASLAEEHYKVEKEAKGGRTSVRVTRLDKEERVKEIARMLGGDEGSATASAHAKELVRQGESNG